MSRVSVVVTTYEGRGLLGECLGALERQTRPPGEVLVVDDASPGDDAAWVRERHAWVRTLRLAANVGHAGAAAAGMAACAGELVAVMNNDAVPEPDWCERAVAPFEDPRVGSVATLLVCADDPGIIDSAGDEYMVVGAAFKRGEGRVVAEAGERREVFSACAAAALYRREALRECGGFEPGLEAYYDDVDVGFRLRLGGWRCVFEPRAIARHRVSASYGRRPWRRLFLDSRNSEWVYLANMPARRLAGHAPERALFFCLQCARRLLAGGLAPFLAGKLAALAGLRTLWRLRGRARRLRGGGRACVEEALFRPWLRHSLQELRRRGLTA